MSTKNSYLLVPLLSLGQRRSSEGNLNANDVMLQGGESLMSSAGLATSQPNLMVHGRRRGSNPLIFDGHLMNSLRNNYDIASGVADFDNIAESRGDRRSGHLKKSSPSMVRGGGQLRTSSPRPLILQNDSKWKNEESSSISSSDSALDELPNEHRNYKWEWLRKEAKSFVDDVINAFETGTPGEQTTQQETEKLSAVQLRKDIKRFYCAVQPYLEVLSALYDIIMWKNPLTTLLLVLVIVYSLYRGWLAALLLLLLIFQLSINYLQSVKNIDLGWLFLPRKPVIMPKFDISGAQLIFDIAKLAQKLLRFGTNILEKIESLFLWKNVRATRIFFILAVYWLCWSVIFTAGTCIGWSLLAVGIRIFVTTYLFQRFPRLRRRFDTYGYFYRNLPLKGTVPPVTSRSQPQTTRSERTITHINELEERCHTPGSKSLSAYCGEKFESRLGSNFNLDQSAAVNLLLGPNYHRHSHAPFPPSHYDSSTNLDANSDGPMAVYTPDSTSDLTSIPAVSSPIHGSGSLPNEHMFGAPSSSRNNSGTSQSSSVEEHDDDEDEHTCVDDCADPIIDNVIAFRSCVMNEKERLFPMGITPGILYLTDAALVFRPRHHSGNKEQLMMLFHDLKLVKKTQSLRSMSLITGTRKSLDIHMEGRRKPVQFIGLAKRDDFVTRIQLMCRNASADVHFAE